jgi:hypothetical protein
MRETVMRFVGNRIVRTKVLDYFSTILIELVAQELQLVRSNDYPFVSPQKLT